MRTRYVALALMPLVLSACSESRVRRDAVAEPAPNAVVGGSPAPAVEPASASAVTLWVEGFGCPMCATNLEYELEEIAGVMDATIDLERGTASVLLAKGESPSASQYRRAAEDSGLSLTRIEGPGFTR